MLQLVPEPKRRVQQNTDTPFSGIAEMLPAPELMQALGLMLPRIARKRVKLDQGMVPTTSIIRRAIVEDDADAKSTGRKDTQPRVNISAHEITTPFGNVRIKSMSSSFTASPVRIVYEKSLT